MEDRPVSHSRMGSFWLGATIPDGRVRAMTDRIEIVGAGVAGLAVAAELVSRGHALRLYERGPGPGPQACSWWAGGMLAPFCEAATAEPSVLAHGRAAPDWWQSMGVDVQRRGTVVVAPSRDRGELERFERRTQGHRRLGAEALSTLEPDLSAHARGLFYEQEAHLAPREALGVLLAGLERAGVELHLGTEAPPPGAALRIDATGMAARPDLSGLRGVKGEMLLLRCPDVVLQRPVRLLHPRVPVYVVPRGQGVFMVGATMIESEDGTRISARSMVELLNAAYTVNPAFGEAEVLEIGVDLRPAFADHLPALRRQGRQLWVNGLYRHGFLLAPAVARMVADHVETGACPEWMDEDRSEW